MSKRADGESALPILVSMGEPSGIGPEIAVKAWSALGGTIDGRSMRLVGSADVFARAAELSNIGTRELQEAVIETGHTAVPEPGRAEVKNAPGVIAAIEASVRACVNGNAAALVTAPIMKAVLTESGFSFPGHTEFLGHLTKSRRAVMMLASHAIDPPLRVVPFTIHIALKDVFGRLDPDTIAETGAIVIEALKTDFGCARPRLALAGLNPHAGEAGTMGREEIDILRPAIARMRELGADIIGPLPADTMFHAEARAAYDAALCLYHDQALIPIKTLAIWSGVNVTLGLPIVRTSPDHGTALDIAGRGIANPESMIAAIRMAADIARRRGL